MSILRPWRLFLSNKVFFRSFPLRLCGLQGFIFSKAGAEKRKNQPDHFSLQSNDRRHFLIMLIIPYTQAKILAFVPHPPDIWTENNNTKLGIGANLEWEAGDNAFNSSFNG